MYTALDIASYIIKSDKVKDLTPLKLQKLLYFVYGIYWSEKKSRLFEETFLAWEYGPVLKNVYTAFKHYGSKKIPKTAIASKHAISDDDKKVIDGVLEAFGGESAAQLVTMTHFTDPWIEAYKNPLNDEIPTSSVHKYFEVVAT